jgi:hypothetical protein
MTSERRHFARVGFDAPAELATAHERFDVKVIDLSFKGALVRVPGQARLKPGTLCGLNVALADTGSSITMSTEVAHVEGSNLGLLCKGIDIDSITHLRRLIEFQLGDPSLLERELKALVSV